MNEKAVELPLKTLQAGEVQNVPFTPQVPVKLVELQCDEGFMLEKVQIGQKVFTNADWVGQLVTPAFVVHSHVRNITDGPLQFRGCWFLEEIAEPKGIAEPQGKAEILDAEIMEESANGTQDSREAAELREFQEGQADQRRRDDPTSMVLVCMKRSQAELAARIGSGAIAHPMELQGFERPFVDAIQRSGIATKRLESSPRQAASNEVRIPMTRSQAELMVAIGRGSVTYELGQFPLPAFRKALVI